MNFRVDLANSDTRNALSECVNFAAAKQMDQAFKVLNDLLKYDQYHQSKGVYPLMDEYKEGQIKFLPTYKYDANSNTYDSSKKQRTPSW